MSITTLPEIDDIVLYQLDYKELYNTCLSSSFLHHHCLHDHTLNLRLKAYNIYDQLIKGSPRYFLFSDVNNHIFVKYGINIPKSITDYPFLINVRFDKAYDGIVAKYTLYHTIKQLHGYPHSSAGINLRKLNVIDFIYDLLLSSKKLEMTEYL